MPIYEYDCEACGTRFEELVFLSSRPKTRRLPGVQQRAGEQAVVVDRRVGERQHARLICVRGVHDQRLRGEPLAGREPAMDAIGPGRCPGLLIRGADARWRRPAEPQPSSHLTGSARRMRSERPGRHPAAPGDSSLPLLPLGPDGVRRAPPRRTRPSARGQHTALPSSLSTRKPRRRDRWWSDVVSCRQEIDTARAVSAGGEGGIRTHGALRLTRFPSARVRPDYATSPRFAGPLRGRRRDYSMRTTASRLPDERPAI